MTRATVSLWRRERLGLSMIAASLIAIVIIAGLLFDYLRDSREAEVRAQGVGLIHLLSTLPFEELAPASNPSAVLGTLKINQDDQNFAFASIVDLDGQKIADFTADGLLLPPLNPPSVPSVWMGEHTVPASDQHPEMIEFFAPLLSDGEIAGYLRLGYFKPGIGFTPTQMAFMGTLALVIFLLTPLFYFLMRREIRPLQAAGTKLHDLLEEGQLRTVEVTTSGELGHFMGNFNRFIEQANQRVAEVEADRERVLTSTKLLSYRKDRILRVIESFPEGILLLNESGVVTVANGHLENTLGVVAEDVVGSESFDWCTQSEVRDYLTRCKASGRNLPEAIEFQTASAANKTYQITAYPLFKPDDSETMGSLVVIRDITVESLARRGRAEFVAHVAHEFKTPLNVLSMYSEALQTAEPDDHESRIEAANVIEEEVKRLSSLINNMLNITKIEMGSLDIDTQRVRIKDLVEDVFKNARLLRLADGLNFEIDVPAKLASLNLDKDLLRIALNNFMTNAIKYNRPGGTVRLIVEELDEVIRIRVTDTGIGISAEDLPHIFEKFYRSETDEVRELTGHGLGLALAKDIIELHNGNVLVESIPGEGTAFTIELWKNVSTMRQVV